MTESDMRKVVASAQAALDHCALDPALAPALDGVKGDVALLLLKSHAANVAMMASAHALGIPLEEVRAVMDTARGDMAHANRRMRNILYGKGAK